MLRVLFLVEDGPLLYDSRVRREAMALRDAGAVVAVVSPGAPGEARREMGTGELHGIELLRYPPSPAGRGVVGHGLEYLWSLGWHVGLSRWWARGDGVDVVHAGNPPDLAWLVVRALGDVRFVYDQHDLVPELCEVRFGRGPLLGLARWLEQRSYRRADHVVVTNDSARRVACERGGRAPGEVSVVRGVPPAGPWQSAEPDARVAGLAPLVVGYIGNMNPQDDVGDLVEAARILVSERGRRDLAFALVGDGTSRPGLEAAAERAGLVGSVHWLGPARWDDRLPSLVAAMDICVQPDRPGPYGQVHSMAKLPEYMGAGRAVVAHDLVETRATAGDAIAYAPTGDASGLARAIEALADDPALRAELGRKARARFEEQLAWSGQRGALLEVYERLAPGRLVGGAGRAP